jgi:thioester reductase-like protein
MISQLLITGGTGLYGSALIEKYLTSEPDTNIYALVRASDRADARERLLDRLKTSFTFTSKIADIFDERVIPLDGDFTLPRLNMDAQAYSGLTGKITDILHSGASVSFSLPLETARSINVTGTENLVEFARNCKNLKAFIHISTGHVAGRWTGTIYENDLGLGQGFLNTYEETKAEAELYLHDHMKEIPVGVYRLLTVIGNHATGHIRQFGFFHNSLRLLASGMIPFLAGDPKGHLDLIPLEYPVEAVYHLHRYNFHPGTTYHICTGPEKSFTLRAFLEETITYFRGALDRYDLQVPEILEAAEFERRIYQRNNPRLDAVMSALDTFIGHLTLPKVFDQTNASRDLSGSGIEVPPVREYYFKVLENCVRRRFGKGAG